LTVTLARGKNYDAIEKAYVKFHSDTKGYG